MRILLSIRILLLLLIANTCFAQNALFKHYTIKDGLPSNKIYGIVEDHEGRIWIGTDRGIARFNGKRFTVFTTANGLLTNDILYFYPDSLGRVWIHDYTPYLTFIQNDTVHEFQVLKNDVPFNKLNYSYANNVAYTSKFSGEIVAGTNEGASVIDIFGLIKNYNPSYNHRKNDGHNSFNYDGRNLIIHDYRGIEYRDLINGTVKSYPYAQNTDSFPFTTYRFGPQFFRSRYLFSVQANKKDSLTFFDFKSGIYKRVPIDPDGDSNAVRGFDAFADHVQITTNKGLSVIDTNLQIRQQFKLPQNLKEIPLNSIYKDHNNGYWISTHNDGIYFVSRELNKYNQLVPTEALQGSPIIKLYFSDGKYYIFNKKNELIITDSAFNAIKTLPLPAFSTFQTDQRKAYLFKDGTRGHYIVSSRGIFYLTPRNELRSIAEHRSPTVLNRFLEYGMNAVKGCVYDESSRCLIFINHVVLLRVWYDGDKFSYKQIVLQRYTNISRGPNKEFWLTDDIGNLSIFDSTLKTQKDYNIGSPITYQTADGRGHMIAVVDGKGIYCYRNGTANIQQLYAGSDIQAIKTDTSGLWVATNNAINHYTYNNSKYVISGIYPNVDGRIYEEVYSIELTPDKVVLICDKGIMQIQKQDAYQNLDRMWASTLRVYALNTGENARYNLPAGTSNYAVDFSKENTNFLFTSNSTAYLGDVYYQYYLEGNDRGWQSTMEEEISYPSLNPGVYTLHLKAIVQHANINTGEYLFTLEVMPAWWQTWWFKALIALLILSIISAAVYQVIKRNRQRALQQANIDKRMAGLELTALQSQMNPHFIFNALSSIQSFINSQDAKLAEDLLQKFSLLIRLYLEFSQHQYISLKHEIKSLDLYTSIERMRFGNRFDIDMYVRNQTSETVQIPPMLVQPLVENAINHGLYHKKEKGMLKVIFWVRKDCIIIIVDDDGIGREAAKKLRAKLFPSRGNKLIKDRIEVLKLSGIADTSMEIKDKKDKFGNSSGTRVILTLKHL